MPYLTSFIHVCQQTTDHHHQQQLQQPRWDDIELWLRGLDGSALLWFENAEEALRRGEIQAGPSVPAQALHGCLLLQTLPVLVPA